MDEKILSPEEVIRLRIAIRDRRRTRFSAEVEPAREGLRASADTESADDEDDSLDDSNMPEEEETTTRDGDIKDASELTVAQLKEMLAAREIDYPANARKADLVALLEQQE
jgi:hypothetical protein